MTAHGLNQARGITIPNALRERVTNCTDTDQLERWAQARRYGRTFARVGRAFPSSQLCSGCGHRDGPKPLHVRVWACGQCGTAHGRDVNAARNILDEGRRITSG